MPSSQCRSRAGSPTRRPCQPSTPVTTESADEERVGAERAVDDDGGELPERRVFDRRLPALQQGGGHEAGGGGAIDEGGGGAEGVDGGVDGEAGVDDEARRQAVDGGDRLADRGRELGRDARTLDLGAVDELVDDRAGAVDRGLTGERRHGERESAAHAGAERAEGDEVGGLFGFGPLAARNADDPVPAVAIR